MRNGLSLSALGTAIFVLLKQKKVKRKLKKLIPMLFDEESEVKEYVNNQVKIMENQRLMMEHLGVKGWDAHSVNTSRLPKTTNLKRKNLLSSLVVLFRARTTGAFTIQTVRSNHSKIREEYIPMKNNLLSRKFLLAVGTSVLIALNDALGWGFNQDTITSVVTVVVGWIAVEGATDLIKKKPPEVNNASYTSREDSEGA
jgi:hypothetical protein